ncbi:MAG: flagellar export chaperone FliS [Syntrophomonas sp.]
MSMNAQAYDNYKKTTVETSSPGKLLLMLYDGAIKNIETAIKAIEEKDINTAHQKLIRTQDIILELISSLNMDYEISKGLFSLYEYINHQLVQANLKKDVNILQEVCSLVAELRDTWAEAIKTTTPAKTQTTVQTGSQAGVSGSPVKSLNIRG